MHQDFRCGNVGDLCPAFSPAMSQIPFIQPSRTALPSGSGWTTPRETPVRKRGLTFPYQLQLFDGANGAMAPLDSSKVIARGSEVIGRSLEAGML